MLKNQAQDVVKETLQNDFDKERFLYFIKNLLNKVDESKAFHARGYVSEAYKKYVKTYERLATYTDQNNCKLDILVVYLQKETSLERARTAQRNFVARYLKDRDQKDAGLVAFVSPDPAHWRFSLVKMEYKFIEGKSGKVKVKEEFTPAKRWSFLVGKNENSHTAQSRLAPIVEDDQVNPTLKQLEDAFNIEKVTKEFFEKYRELFLRVHETLNNVIRQHPDIKADFAEKNVDTVDFSKKLLGQIVFLYFLQKKGWFGVPMNKSWGDGDKKFLRTLYEEASSKSKNYFNDYLEPLFYEALAKERDDDFYSRFECKIPFLNGGLFDPISNYDWVNTVIDLPDDIFSNTRKTKDGDTGDGILDIFDRYNFTVKEDEPLEKEVAIDPEMLGKVFENLLEVKDRKSKGTYYTPREIVHYMCEQSLMNYLATELEGKVSKEDLEKLIKIGENVVEHEAVSISKEDNPEYGGDYNRLLPDSIKEFARVIDNKLATIKVCDPAIGSGAFPVGMMNAIVKARMVLQESYLKNKNRTPYTLKRDCIQNSLYGVDIDPGAVEIAKLRLWLSLVVDEDDIKRIKPLPNLDYKIMQGNSLLEEFEGIKLFDERLIAVGDTGKEKELESLQQKQSVLQKEYFELHSQNRLTKAKQVELRSELKQLQVQIKKLNQADKVTVENAGLFDMYSEAKKKAKDLKRLHKEFFEATQKSKKDNIKKQIEKLEWELIEATFKEQHKISALKKIDEFKRSNTKPFFLWKLNFADVFEEKGGFDVVIANPPYGANIDKDIAVYERCYPNTTKSFKDIYKIFIELGLTKLAKESNGTLCYIVPNTLLLQPRYRDVRQYVLNYKIVKIINLGENVFENVVVPTCVILVEKSRPSGSLIFIDLSSQSKYSGGIDSAERLFLKQSQYSRIEGNIFIKSVRPLKSDELFLDEIFECKDGGIKYQRVRIGLSKKGTNDLAERLFYKGNKQNTDDIKFFTGSNLNKNGWYLCLDNLQVLRHNYRKILKNNEKIYWNKKLFLVKEKLVWRQTSSFFAGTYLDKGVWFSNTVQAGYIKPEFANLFNIKYILALLNSKYLRFLYSISVQESGRVFPQVKLVKLKNLPIKKIVPEAQKPFIDCVEKILKIAQTDDYLKNTEKQARVHDLECQIDEMVYKLYGLTDEEIKVVEAK